MRHQTPDGSPCPRPSAGQLTSAASLAADGLVEHDAPAVLLAVAERVAAGHPEPPADEPRVTAPDEVVHQCGSGVTACHNLLAMEAAGLPGSVLYPGSWSEWSSDPTRPVAIG